MWNVLLDPFPEEWNGYPIDSDFQTGIQISQCLADEDLSRIERFLIALDLLFVDKDNRPDFEEAMMALHWFLTEYHHDNNSDEPTNAKVMDFDIDQWRIYAAFLNQYHIDLNTAKLHWFAFMGLLSNLNECSFTGVMNVRQKEITVKMSAEEKNALMKAKKIFEIKVSKEEHLSVEEQQAVDEFNKLRNKNK